TADDCKHLLFDLETANQRMIGLLGELLNLGDPANNYDARVEAEKIPPLLAEALRSGDQGPLRSGLYEAGSSYTRFVPDALPMSIDDMKTLARQAEHGVNKSLDAMKAVQTECRGLLDLSDQARMDSAILHAIVDTQTIGAFFNGFID